MMNLFLVLSPSLYYSCKTLSIFLISSKASILKLHIRLEKGKSILIKSSPNIVGIIISRWILNFLEFNESLNIFITNEGMIMEWFNPPLLTLVWELKLCSFLQAESLYYGENNHRQLINWLYFGKYVFCQCFSLQQQKLFHFLLRWNVA